MAKKKKEVKESKFQPEPPTMDRKDITQKSLGIPAEKSSQLGLGYEKRAYTPEELNKLRTGSQLLGQKAAEATTAGVGAGTANASYIAQLKEQENREKLMQAMQGQEISETKIPIGSFEQPAAFGEDMPSILSEGARQAIAGKLGYQAIEAGTITGLSESVLGQGVQRLGLNDLDIEVLKSGEAKVTAFQQLIETIPVVGRLTNKWLGSANTPTSRINTILKQVKELETQIIDNTSYAKSNPILAGTYLKQVEDAEQEILRLESKIKLLTIQSPELQGDPEAVNLIEKQIIGTKAKILQSKIQLSILL